MSRKSFYKQTATVEKASTTTVFEIEKPSHFSQSEVLLPTPSLKHQSRWGQWFISAGIIFLLMVIGGLCSVMWWYWNSFSQTTGTNPLPILQTVWANRSNNVFSDRPYKTFLLLGLDQSSQLREESALTDTVIFSKVSQDGSIKLVSLPRDLWLDSLKTKINALYYYGQQANPGDGITLVSSVITEITGYPIDYYFIITMDTVKDLVDALGGVDIEVANTFEDLKFPREIDLRSKDLSILYETVRFEKGTQHMDGTTALKFIRSRHSVDTFEGTDEGREKRQQLLLAVLKKKLLQPETVSDPKRLGSLYTVWKNSVKTNMSESDLLLLAKQLSGTPVTINSHTIPIQTATSPGLLYHPLQGPAKQWVFLPVDSTWKQLNLWFKEQW